MKNIFLLLLVIISIESHAQETVVKNEFTIAKSETIDFDKIYNKKTGKKIEKDDFIEMIKENPHINLERVIDENGEIEKYFYDNDNQSELKPVNKKLSPGDDFPNSNLKTLSQKEINLEDLKGKLVVIRFELFADNFRFKKHEIVELDKQINLIENKEEKIEAIIIFTTPEDEILKGFDIEDSNFELVANGMNFHQRYFIDSYPTTAIIDKEGKLIDYFFDLDDIDLKALLAE